MKKILLVVLLLATAGCATAAQAPRGQFTFFSVQAEVAPLPPVDLSFKTLIELLADYSVIHEQNNGMGTRAYGMTVRDHRRIHIDDTGPRSIRIQTVLHEFLHALYWEKNVATGGPYEEQIEALASDLYNRVWGISAKANPRPEEMVCTQAPSTPPVILVPPASESEPAPEQRKH